VTELLYRLRTGALKFAQRALARPGPVEHDGVALVVSPGVHHPGPFLGLGVQALQRAALRAIPPGSRVLELGTGAGFWALRAAQQGFDVIATDLPPVPLEPVAQAASRLGVTLRVLHSNLFEALDGERFDAVLFNPPFHDAEPTSDDERAWCGGAVVRAFLATASRYLRPDGALYVIMPTLDRRRYDGALAPWAVSVADSRWYPLLGRTELLVLRAL
jgi:methylase of polypeptide subunit release factors